MKRMMISLFLIFSMGLVLLSSCAQRAAPNVSGVETEETTISPETKISATKKETQKETVASTAESTTISETTLASEPQTGTPEADFETRLDAGEIIAWKSGDRLELNYESEGEEVIEYSTTADYSENTVTYTLNVNGSIVNNDPFFADAVCYLAKVSDHTIFLVGAGDAGSTWWTDIYTYAYGDLVYLGEILYTSPGGDTDKFWIDSDGVLNNRYEAGWLGIVDYVQRRIVAESTYDGSSDSISLVEVPVGLNPMGFYVTAQTSVQVYSNRYGDSTEWTINPGDDVILVATDVLEYVYVEKADHSQKGWIRIDYYENTCQVSDGTLMNIYDVFSGMPMGG